MSVKIYKQLQQSQLVQLQSRFDEETQLIEDMREYVRRRTEIEAEYARGHDRLNKFFLSKLRKKAPAANLTEEVR